MKKIFVLFITSFLYVSGSIYGQTQNSVPVTFNASFFGNYSYTVQGIEGQDFNKFDIERMYLTFKSQISENWKLQATTDIYRNTDAGTYYKGLAVRLKFGFIDYTPWQSLSIKAGMIPGPWVGTVESFWKYRGVSATASDKFSYLPTADLGASVTYSLPDKYGELAGYVYNGDSFSSPETNQYKDYVLRGLLVPFPTSPELKNLSLGVCVAFGKSGTAGLTKNRVGGFLGYSYDFVIVGAEYDTKTDGVANAADISGNVYSLFTEIKFPIAELQSKLSLIFRYDSSDPNVNKDNDRNKFFIAGFVWKPTEKISFVLDRQVLTSDALTLKTTAGTFVDKDEKWFVHTIVNL